MGVSDRLMSLVESGKQVGLRVTILRNGESTHVAIALQKNNDTYCLYFYEIKDKNIHSEEFEKRDWGRFARLGDALCHLSRTSELDANEMVALKGSRLFDPEDVPG